MNIQIKKSLLGLAGALALVGAGAAQAQLPFHPQTYNTVTYIGETTLRDAGGTPVTCTLTISGQIDRGTGDVQVYAAGVVGNTPCEFVYTGNMNWQGTLTPAGIGPTSGTLNLATPAAFVLATGSQCSGPVNGILWTSTDGDNPPDTITIPTLTPFGNCTIEGTLYRH